METKAKNTKRNEVVLVFDVLMLTGFVVTSAERFEGRTLHEWFGIGCAVLAIIHLLINWEWIVATTKRLFRAIQWQNKVNYILNIALFIDAVIITFSGLMISEVVMPAIGIEMPRGGAWRQTHSLASDLFLTLIGVHLALHLGWIWRTLRRFVSGVRTPRLAAARIEEVRS